MLDLLLRGRKMSDIITSSNLDRVIQDNLKIAEKVSEYAFNIQTSTSILRVSSMPQLALCILRGYGLVQMPIEDKYWSGAIFVKEGKLIPVINTALPRVNQYYTSWHEIYHLLFDKVSSDHIIENNNVVDERKAEYFASCMLLKGVDRYFRELPPMDFVSKIFYCMSAFQAPYKAVLISLYEDAVKTENEKMKESIKEVFDLKFDDIGERFQKLGLDDSLVTPSFVINVSYLEERIEQSRSGDPELKYHEFNEKFLNNITNEIRLLTRANQ